MGQNVFTRAAMAWKGIDDDSGIWFTTGMETDPFPSTAWAPQQNVQTLMFVAGPPGGGTWILAPVGTTDRPALALYNGLLVMAWKGAGNDAGIWFSTYEGNGGGTGWAPQKPVLGVGTSAAPALAVYNGLLYMAWKGAGDDTGIWFTTGVQADGSINWARQLNVTFFDSQGTQQWIPVGTSDRPSLTVYNGQLYMAWKGAGDDEGIWWTSFQSFEGNVPGAPPGGLGQAQVPGVGTTNGPALAAYNGLLYLAWKGAGDDTGIWFRAAVKGDPFLLWQTPQQNVPGVGTSLGPALTAYSGLLYMAWKGAGDDEGIWWTVYDGSNWASWVQGNVSGVGTSVGPSLALTQQPFMAWRGDGTDQTIWFSNFDTDVGNWTGQQQNPNVGSEIGPALALSSGKIHMAWKGVAGDTRLFYSSFLASSSGIEWADQQQIPGVFSSVGPALTVFGGFIHPDPNSPGNFSLGDGLFAAWGGDGTDTSIWFATYDGSQWSGQQQVPGPVFTSHRPAVVAFQGKLLMVWKGDGEDTRLWYTTYDTDTSSWAAQQQLLQPDGSNVFSSAGPALTVFAGQAVAAWRGEFSDTRISFTTYNGIQWSPQQSIPGASSSEGPTLGAYDIYLGSNNVSDYNGVLYMAWRGAIQDGRDDTRIFYTTARQQQGTINWNTPQLIQGIFSKVGPALVNLC